MAVSSIRKYTKCTLLTLLLSATALTSSWAKDGKPVYPGEDEQVGSLEEGNYEEYHSDFHHDYYKIVLDEDAMSTDDNVTWEESDVSTSKTVQVKLPNNDTRLFNYTEVPGHSSIVSDHHAENGGAIYNTGQAYDIVDKNFLRNNASSSSSVYASGGAIYNEKGPRNNVTDTSFVANYVTADAQAKGGAIYNSEDSYLDIDDSNFIGNSVKTTGGGQGVQVQARGGAIYNAGILSGDWINFVGNVAKGANAEGGAIYNIGELNGYLGGDFVANRAEGVQDNAKGGAIYNEGDNYLDLGLKGSFIGNIAKATNSGAYGGALANVQGPKIADIEGKFIGNVAQGYYAEGGAISNYYDTNIENLDALFIQNEAVSTLYNAYGGAISNSYDSVIQEMRGKYNNNRASAENKEAYGGAISNFGGGRIGTIEEGTGFSHNVAEGNYAEGGAISNDTEATIGNIYGSFDGNQARARNDDAFGGAISNSNGAEIEAISDVEFMENVASSENGNAFGGAISNANGAKIGSIQRDATYDFGVRNEGNKAVAESGNAYGGSIYNGGEISEINNIYFHENAAEGGDVAQGGAIFNDSHAIIGEADMSAIRNSAHAEDGNAYGGAISNADEAAIGTLSGDFEGNEAVSENGDAFGGAIYNDGQIMKITDVALRSNGAVGKDTSQGGAIYNIGNSGIGEISGSFERNSASSSESDAYGGAISNSSVIKNIKYGAYTNNKVSTEDGKAYGGAISNADGGEIEKIGDENTSIIFSGNVAESEDGYAAGGAISNDAEATFGEIYAKFEGNKAKTKSGEAFGGAVSNANEATVDTLNAVFSDNVVSSESGDAFGGAISNTSGAEIGTIQSEYSVGFSGNEAHSKDGDVFGGAIYNADGASIGQISVDFSGNKAGSDNGNAFGGAIYNEGQITEITNANFVDNKVVGGANSNGGAIYTMADLFLNADGGSVTFDHNEVNGVSNDIYADNATVTMNAAHEGLVSLDTIDGNSYNVVLDGDGTGRVVFNTADNIDNLNFKNKAVLNMQTPTQINTKNMSVADGADPTLSVNVRLNSVNKTTTSGIINVSDQVSGKYNVIVNALEGTGYEGAQTVFVNAPNDINPNDEDFNVSRVIGSPYAWSALRNMKGTESGSVWYLAIPEGPTPPAREVTPEVIAGIGMQDAAILQVHNLARNAERKVADSKVNCAGNGTFNYNWRGTPQRNVWMNVDGETVKNENAANMDGKIWGIDAGFDVQADRYHAIGLFGSYRNGKYDLNGKSDKYYSKIGSDIDIDSYIGGMYYRFDKDLNWLFAMVYSGMLKSDVTTDDHIAKFDTDGYLIGAGLSFGHDFVIANGLILEPALGLYYDFVSFDDAVDNVGKKYKWDDMHYAEAEFGVKLEKQLAYQSKLYIKPSIIQTWRSGNSVKITNLGHADTGDNQTLGRVEIGGRIGFTNALSGYTWANYTFGEHSYEATAAGAGLNYSW